MPDTRLRSADAPALLREDHDQLRDLFRSYQQLGDEPRPSKQELFELIRRTLAVLAVVEEDVFYPAVEQAPDRGAARMVAEARREHRILKSLLAELGALTPDAEGYDERIGVLRETVERHAEEEEQRLFAVFHRLPPDVRDDVSDRLRTRKSQMSDLMDPEAP